MTARQLLSDLQHNHIEIIIIISQYNNFKLNFIVNLMPATNIPLQVQDAIISG